MNIDISRLYKVYKNLHIMLKARNYEPSDPELDKKSFTTHLELMILEHQDNPYELLNQLVLYFVNTDDQRVLMVYFHVLESKFKKEDMEYINKKLVVSTANELIIIVKENITPRVTNILQVMESNVQLFCMDELLINITEHQLVPKHELLSDEQKTQLLTFYKCNENDFPAILDTDPIVKYYNWKVGSCIKITRHSPYYRIVKSVMNS